MYKTFDELENIQQEMGQRLEERQLKSKHK